MSITFYLSYPHNVLQLNTKMIRFNEYYIYKIVFFKT